MEELDWSAERQVLIPAEHLCVTLNADLEPEIHHQTPMTYGYSHFIHFETVAAEVEIHFSSTGNYVSIFVTTVWKCLFSSKEGSVPVLLSI